MPRAKSKLTVGKPVRQHPDGVLQMGNKGRKGNGSARGRKQEQTVAGCPWCPCLGGRPEQKPEGMKDKPNLRGFLLKGWPVIP